MRGAHMKGRRKKEIIAEQRYNSMQERFFTVLDAPAFRVEVVNAVAGDD